MSGGAMAGKWGTVPVAGTGGLRLAAHHLGGDGPPVLLAHATGFHGWCWAPLAAALVPDFTVWALDFRAHGDSDRDPEDDYQDWDVFAHDVLAALDALSERTGWSGPWRAAGHSLGGNAVLSAEALRPHTFAAIACYEPVVFPPFDEPPAGGSSRLSEGARRRRTTFASRQEALANYASKPPFGRFDPDALSAYVEHGFRDQADGTVTLACRREDEAAIYEGAMRSPQWGRLPAVPAPVTILAGGPGADPVQGIAAGVARRIPRGGYRELPHLDHFGPMTAPAEVGTLLHAALSVATP